MFYLAQAGASLQAIQSAGTVTTLTLPAGVTIDPTIHGRFGILSQQIVFVGAPSVNLWIDPVTLTVRALGIEPPLASPVLSDGGGTGLTGAYRPGVAFAVKNADGVILNRSPVVGPGAAITVADAALLWSDIPVSSNPDVNCRILYRTAAGGTDLFEAIEIDDNVTTSWLDATPDAALDPVVADTSLGVPPGSIPGTSLTLLVDWKSRFWAVSGAYNERDQVRFTDVDEIYGWSPFNFVIASPKGEDAFGVTGFLRRRDALGILKRTRVLKLIGSSPDDFEVIIVAEAVGCLSPDTCVVIRDKGYFLGADGVYRWDDNGVVCISRDAVDPWFTTDNYFERARFPVAFAGWNPVTNAYELCLSNGGTHVENVWVSFHIDANGGKGEWLGPHSTTAFTSTARGRLEDDTGLLLPVIGASDGYLYKQNQTTPSDVTGGTLTAHAISGTWSTKWHAANAPDVTHYFGRLSVLSRIEANLGGTLSVNAYVGRLDTVAPTAQATVDLTLGRQILKRLGVGPLCRLQFIQSTVGKRFLVYGYEIKPVSEVGVR